MRLKLLLVGLWLAAAALAAAAQPASEPADPPPSAAVAKLLQEGAALYRARKPAEALAAAERAAAAARDAGDAVGEAVSQRIRARLLEELRRDEEATTAWRDSAAAWERAGETPGRIEALCAAAALVATGKPGEARALLDEALSLARKEARRPVTAAQALNGAALGLYGRGRLSEASELYAAALALLEQRAPGSLDVAASLNGLGIVAGARGDLATAGEHFERVRTIQEKLAPGSLGLAGTLYNLGLLARSRGDLAGSYELNQRALAIREKLAPQSLALTQSLNSLGALAHDQGDFEAARDYFQRALSLQERLAPGSPDVGHSLNNLGTVLHGLRALPQARDLYRRALEIRERHAPGSLDVAASLNNLGVVSRDLGEHEAAAGYYQRALALHERHSPGSLAVAANLQNLGDLARDRGNAAEAGEHHRRAFVIRQKLAPSSLVAAESLGSLGLLALDAGDVGEAERLLDQAWSIIRRQGRVPAGDERRQAFHARTAAFAASLVDCRVRAGRAREALVTLEESRAQALQQLLAERDLDQRSTDPKLWARYQEAVRARNLAEQQLAAASLAAARAGRTPGGGAEVAPEPEGDAGIAPQARELEAARASYVRARERADDLWAEIRKGAARAFLPSPPADAAKAVPSQALFVAFGVDRKRTHVFLLAAGEAVPRAHTLPVSEGELQKLVERFGRAVAERSGAAAGLGRSLFAALFPGEAGKRVLAAKRLLLSPDGPLWHVPFAALVVNAQGSPRYLGVEKPLSFTPSLTVLAQARADRARRPAGAKPACLVLGNPVFDRGAGPAGPAVAGTLRLLNGKPPPPLPATAVEAAALSRLYGSPALTGEQATEAAVRARIGTADVVHLATHGFLHPRRPMSSGVLLTPPAAEPRAGESANDGLLQAWEIFSELKLRAELVALSACDTGGGETVRAEGIVGLTRALQYAGARSVLASRWKVADGSTSTLMVRFHEKLRGGAAKDEALRQAMAAVQGAAKTAHPYYWAAFFLTGDPDNPLPGR